MRLIRCGNHARVSASFSQFTSTYQYIFTNPLHWLKLTFLCFQSQKHWNRSPANDRTWKSYLRWEARRITTISPGRYSVYLWVGFFISTFLEETSTSLISKSDYLIHRPHLLRTRNWYIAYLLKRLYCISVIKVDFTTELRSWTSEKTPWRLSWTIRVGESQLKLAIHSYHPFKILCAPEKLSRLFFYKSSKKN